MTAPTFPRFATAPKCDPAQLAQPPELLLDRPVRKTASLWRSEAFWCAILAAVVVYAGWYAYRTGGIERRVAELEEIHARQAELARIVGNEEAIELMGADRERAAVVRAIERTMDRLIISEGTE